MTLKVFVSSTRSDLEACRVALLGQLVNLGKVTPEPIEPVQMDTWPSVHDLSVDWCMRQLREVSTHFTGLFAHRRGWEPSDEDTDSITELEYDAALAFHSDAGTVDHMAIYIPAPDSPIDDQLHAVADTLEPSG